MQWNPAVRARYQALLKALADRFDGKVFAVNLPETGGGFQLLIPTTSASMFMTTAVEESPAKKSSAQSAMNTGFADKLLESSFTVDLTLLGGKVEANHLLNLSAGKILTLGISVRTPVVMKIGGRDTFEAVPVRSGHHRTHDHRYPPARLGAVGHQDPRRAHQPRDGRSDIRQHAARRPAELS